MAAVPVLVPASTEDFPKSTNPRYKNASKMPPALKPQPVEKEQVDAYISGLDYAKRRALFDLWHFALSVVECGVAREVAGASQTVKEQLERLFMWDNRDLEPKLNRKQTELGAQIQCLDEGC